MSGLLCGSFCILEKVGDYLAAKRNPKADEAYKLYKDGMKLVDIAAKLGVPDGTVRRWKSTHGWDGERSGKKDKKKANVRKERERKHNVIDDGIKETLQNEELSSEQQMFCIYYIRTFNATQSYQKAYGCSYETALRAGSRLMGKDGVRKEIARLKEIKLRNMDVSDDDIVELQMRIAFADIGDYVTFGNNGTNWVNIASSKNVDTQIIQEVKEGQSGVSIKLADRQKAIDWLTTHFMMNPMDEHRTEFDKKRLELEYLKLDAQIKADEVADEDPEDNFLEALNAAATEVWGDEDGME